MPRAGVREERLRSTAGLRQDSPMSSCPTSSCPTSFCPMSSWRGASGRRYVVGVRPSLAPEAVDLAGAVLIAVRRGGDGTASVVDVTVPDPATTRRSRLRWLALMRTRGATELHVHLLAEDDAARDAVRRDLSAPAA